MNVNDTRKIGLIVMDWKMEGSMWGDKVCYNSCRWSGWLGSETDFT